MPAPTVVSDFLDCVRKSNVADAKAMDDFLAGTGADAPATPAQMADALVREGLLTRFQADQMLRGRWRNFILSGKYTILEPIGAGGMGTVYLCSHRIMHRPVAVKVLPASQADDPGAIERFHREARAVAQLRHPNIVGAHDIDRDGKFHFFVMEYVDGVSLQELVHRRGPLDPVHAAHYIHQAAFGLQYAHEAAGLVHRDIKPANLLVDRTGVVKILDLGLARFFHDKKESLTQKYDGNAVLGTADYLAPEQAVDSHNVDIRCDIYSLGITFYFLLAGHSPFQDGSVAEKLIWHQVRQPKPIREVRPDVPEGMADILQKMIEKEPVRRYQTPMEVAEALAPWTQEPIEPPSAKDIPPITAAARRAGVSEVNYTAPRTPSPNTPSPGGVKPASNGRKKTVAVAEETATRTDGLTKAVPSLTTMKSVPDSPSSRRRLGSGDAEAPPVRRFPWVVVAAAVAGVLLLAGVTLALAVAFLLPWGNSPPTGTVNSPAPPNSGGSTPPPPAPVMPATGVAVRQEGDSLHVRAANYEAVVGADGCLNSLRVGGVEFLKPGEPIFGGKTLAKGAYFYSEQPPHLGTVQMPHIEQPSPNVIKASGDKFSVTYRFTPDALTLSATNATDDSAPYFIILDSGQVTDVENGKGEHLAVPVAGNPKDPTDPKWATTTWTAGRSSLKITRKDSGGTKIWGPFGSAKSQVWDTEVETYHTAEVRLEPAVAAGEEKPTLPAGGVLVTRQADNRRVQTDLYEAVVEGDGCLTSLHLVDGVEFLKPGVGISRGVYFHQQDTEKLPEVAQPNPTVITAQGPNAAIRYEFKPEKMVWSVENKTDQGMQFYVVFDTTVIAVRNAKDEWAKTPLGDQKTPDAKWATTTWFAGGARITLTGGSNVWGPWEQKYQVWEASLAPKEKRVVTVEVGPASKEEAEKAAATAGVKPVLPSDLPLNAPLDYQVFQRKTRTQGTIAVRGRVRPAFDRLEYHLTGKPLEGAVPEGWQELPRTEGSPSFDAALPAPAGGWYKLEVRALKDGKEVTQAAVDHVGVGEVFVGAGQSNSTNCGQEKIQQTTNMVSSFSGTDWRPADDPQPGCHDNSTGGSYWPAFGDAMYEKYHVPIGVAVTGHSGTSITQWEPGGELFLWTLGRMKQLGRNGFRAVLWHQGESDTGMSADEYGKKLTTLIQDSGKAAGWDVPWFVAQVSYHNPSDPSSPSTREAQKKLWDSGVALEGPDTDTLTGDMRDNNGQGIHFSPKGLLAHGKMWADKVGVWLDKVLAK